mgnify:CR=1 FL=1
MLSEINRNSVRNDPESLSSLALIITCESGKRLSGMPGRFEPEQVAGLSRNLHFPLD